MGAVDEGVPLRETGCFAKPSGKSFHAGRFLAVVYEVRLEGDWVEARGGGGIPPTGGGGTPKDCCRG